MKIQNVYDFLNEKAPFNTAAQWDNTGLSVGSLDKAVTKIILSLDVTKGVIETAQNVGAELLITHHPLIFNPVKRIPCDSVLYKAVNSGITFISSHTCLDKADGGVNDCLKKAVGIINDYASQFDEFFKVGFLEKPMMPNEFAAYLKTALGGSVRYCDAKKPIKKVAFCSGSGGEYAEFSRAEGADALLTGDASHHEFLEALDCGVSLFAAGHFETEIVVIDYLYNILTEKFGSEIEIIKAEECSPIITE